MSIEDNTRYTHKIYENDPTLFESYINQHVTIAAKDSSVHHGILYTVDPVSERLDGKQRIINYFFPLIFNIFIC